MNPIVSMIEDATETECRDVKAVHVIDAIRSGRWREKIDYIRSEYAKALAEAGSVTTAKKAVCGLKKALPGVCWSGKFSVRKGESLVAHSGLLCADLDELGEKLPSLRQRLIADARVFSLFTSPTGTGLKVLFRVAADGDRHPASFAAVSAYCLKEYGTKIDTSCRDLARLCFVSFDPDAYLNRDADELPITDEPKTGLPAVPSATIIQGDVRSRIAGELLGEIEWTTETRGYCRCPGQRLHSTDNGRRDTEIHLDGVPTIHCLHNSCAGLLAGVNHELRSRIGKAEHRSESSANTDQPDSGRSGRSFPTPLEFFLKRFPGLADKYGSPVSEQADAKGVVSVRDISEDFMAATLGFDGCAESPTVFVPTEQSFYRFSPANGIYMLQREPVLVAGLSELFLECARACREGCDTRSLEFRFRDSASLAGTLRKAKGLLEVGPDFFSANLTEYIPCANGMLRLSDGALRPFDPSYRRRNKLAVPFVPGATCPLFIETLMRPALEADDLNLLQRWCGLALVGENLAQRIILLSGTPGGGKGTFIRVLAGIIGKNNIASLRPNLLGERFELGRFLGRTLLYGADVPENFLNCRGASVIKMLTGGDPATLELKGSNERPEVTCKFNVIATSNSRLTVNLEGDADAWRRRLAIIRYERPKSQRVIVDLSERIIATEGSGVLNWMLEGLVQICADGWQLRLNSRQQEVVDGLLMESGGHTWFVRDQLERVDGQQGITIADTYAAYVAYCNERSWTTLPRNKFAQEAADVIARQYGIVVRHDIPDQTGKRQRGWKGLALVSNFPGPSEKKASETSEPVSEPPSPDASDGCLPVGPVKNGEPQEVLL